MKIYYIRDCVSGAGSGLIEEFSDESFIRSLGYAALDQDIPAKVRCDVVGVCLGELIDNPGGYPTIKAYEVPVPVCTAQEAFLSVADRGGDSIE